MKIAAVVGHLVRGPVLAHRGVAAVAAVSHLVPEAGGGCEGHDPVFIHCNTAIGVCFMESSQLFVRVWHYIGIAKCFFQGV